MKKSTFAVVLSVLASFVVFFYSININFYLRGREYLEFKLNEGKFAMVQGTCLIQASINRERLNREGVPSKILSFFCRKSDTESFGHAVTVYHSGNYLSMYDNDASIVLCKLTELDLNSDPKKIISKKYNYVVEAHWLNLDDIH